MKLFSDSTNDFSREKSYQHGLSLIELLVSMVIGLFIMAGVLQLFTTSNQNAIASTGVSRVQEGARYVFSRIAEDIAQSGNLGCMSASVVSRSPYDKPAITNMLSGVTVGGAYDFLSTVHGNNGTGASGLASTDSFRIRYVDHLMRFDVAAMSPLTVGLSYNADSSIEAASLPRIGEIVAVSNCFEGAIFSVTNVVTTGAGNAGLATLSHTTQLTVGGEDIPVPNATTDKEISALFSNFDTEVSNILSPFYLYSGETGSYEYTVGTAAGADDCDPDIAPQNCALFRSESGVVQELVKGVNDLQVTYGWVDAAGDLRFSTSPSNTQWPLIDRMRVSITLNSVDQAYNTQGVDGLVLKTYERTFNLFNQL